MLNIATSKTDHNQVSNSSHVLLLSRSSSYRRYSNFRPLSRGGYSLIVREKRRPTHREAKLRDISSLAAVRSFAATDRTRLRSNAHERRLRETTPQSPPFNFPSIKGARSRRRETSQAEPPYLCDRSAVSSRTPRPGPTNTALPLRALGGPANGRL